MARQCARAVPRRAAGRRHRRRDDPRRRCSTHCCSRGVTLVAHLQPAARGPVSRRPAARALPAGDRAARISARRAAGRRRHRLPPAPAAPGADLPRHRATRPTPARHRRRCTQQLAGEHGDAATASCASAAASCVPGAAAATWSGSASRRCATARAARTTTSSSPRDFHTVFLSDVPVIDEADDDAARRFIALVDEFYDQGVKLVLSAAATPPRAVSRASGCASSSSAPRAA